MRITETQTAFAAYASGPAKTRSAAAVSSAESEGVSGYGSSGSLSLPDLLRLTSTENPERHHFLTALSQSLRSGLETTDPSHVATSILRNGFDVRGPQE